MKKTRQPTIKPKELFGYSQPKKPWSCSAFCNSMCCCSEEQMVKSRNFTSHFGVLSIPQRAERCRAIPNSNHRTYPTVPYGSETGRLTHTISYPRDISCCYLFSIHTDITCVIQYIHTCMHVSTFRGNNCFNVIVILRRIYTVVRFYF